MRRAILIAAFVLAHVASAGASNYCFEEAEQYYNVSAKILWAISKNESGHKPTALNYNTNGTIDFCHMQINSSWRKVIGDDAWRALNDPCYCTMVGAWVFAQCVEKYGYTWDAVGCYHSQSKDRRSRYAIRIYSILKKAEADTAGRDECLTCSVATQNKSSRKASF